MNTYHSQVKLRTDSQRKDGTCSLHLYANINGKRMFFSLHKSIPEKYWNPDKQEVKIVCPNAVIINSTIKDYLQKAEKLMLSANINSKIVSKSDLEDILRSEPYDSNDFFAFAENDIKEFGSKFAPATIANNNVQLKKLKEF
ncbi:MAG TPA: Arm DNA-binding domain-containing protein [Bacteroidales bacterium]|nr:Arm DNA-binding domain-containing protein [Bacteroidales bacterium]HPT02965.1 Arm DNA-binding domain-containing protein [Bacteroidales bacterium]